MQVSWHKQNKTKQKTDTVKEKKKETAKTNVEQIQSRELSGLSTSWNNEKETMFHFMLIVSRINIFVYFTK